VGGHYQPLAASLTTTLSSFIILLFHYDCLRFADSKHSLYHMAHCYLPLSAAHVISHDPRVLPAAVHALCERGRDTVRGSPQVFSPVPRGCVMRAVRFTKLLYAMLNQHQLSAPRGSGFNIPPPGNPNHKSHDLGMKLVSHMTLM